MSSDDESAPPASPNTTAAGRDAPPTSEAERQLLHRAQYDLAAVRVPADGLQNAVLATGYRDCQGSVNPSPSS